MATKCIPLIDMENDSKVAEKIVRAFEEWGCFRMINHGVSMELMSEMKVVARSLTDLPMETKMKNLHPDTPKGYTPPNKAGPFFEGLSIYDVVSAGAIEDFCSKLQVSPHQREVVREYALSLHDVALLVGRKVMEGLGMEGELFENWICQMKMNKYNYSPDTVGLIGSMMHSDPAFLTILQDDEIVGGLEAVDEISGELVPINLIPGTFVVSTGDVAKVWSNGKFCNMKHQVQCYEPNVRTSIPFFVLAPRNEEVETPPQMVEYSNHRRLYTSFEFESYRELRARIILPMGEGLEYFRAEEV